MSQLTTQTSPHRLRAVYPPVVVAHAVPGTWLPMTQNWIHNQLAHLGSRFENHVICDAVENEAHFPVDGVHLRPRPGVVDRAMRRAWKRMSQLRRSAHVQRVIRQTGAQVLHSHFGSVAWENIDAAERAGVIHVATFYGMDVCYLPRNGWQRRYDALFESIDAILCEGPHMAQQIVDLGCDASKVHVQHLGVRIDDIPYEPLHWDGVEPLRFILAATFREKKGMPDALEAIGRLSRRHPVEVTIIGDAGNSDASRAEKARMLLTIDRHGMADRVRFLGNTTYATMMSEARRAHIFMHPSVTAKDGHTEGGAPVVLIDMAASGRVIVASTHCDIPEIITHNRTGLLAGEHDVDGLVSHLETLVSSPERWRSLTDAGREHVEIEFNCRTLGPRLGRMYRGLLGEGCMPSSEWSPRDPGPGDVPLEDIDTPRRKAA